MSYTVLARRYRASSFTEVVGQQPIAQTLQNAIATGRVAHAYLFTGTRGVGKTSMARILARALNAPDTIEDCPTPADHDQYPQPPVQQRMGDAIMRGEDLNVIEIDGASNNSVDQARQLIANAALSPTGNARYKVYIIDEVHMLSPHAFNALLKTMEEPPEHVKFILCTTEPHKIPPTIQSRCQRFDFRNIATASIAAHLRSVLDEEKLESQEQVLWQLARLGNGSMRDALSLLDRLIATGQQPLTDQLLESMLGLPPQDLVVQWVDAIADGDVAKTLQRLAVLLDRGIAPDQLIDVLIEHFRQLMLISACGADSELIELSDEARATAAKQASRFDTPGLVHMIAVCENLQRYSKLSSNARALLDATAARLALAEKMADVTAILAAAASRERKKKEVTTAQPDRRPVVAVAAGAGEPPAKTTADQSTSATLPTEVGAIWSKLLDAASDKPSLSWLSKMRLDRLNGADAHLALLPGHRDLVHFASRQSERLGELFRSILGRRVRVHIDAPKRLGTTDDPPQSSEGARGATRVDQQQAMTLPMVRQVLEKFDATLIDARSKSDDA